LPGEFFEFVDRPGNQAFDLPGDHHPQQHAEDQNPRLAVRVPV
jgi:hypothetical protein